MVSRPPKEVASASVPTTNRKVGEEGSERVLFFLNVDGDELFEDVKIVVVCSGGV